MRTIDITPARALESLKDLGDLGLVVSIAYGPMHNGQVCFSVDVRNRKGESFGLPYMAESFGHAVWIAADQAIRRGWL